MNVRVHAFEERSKVNGPGVRAVIWVQGCTLGCPGCFNPDTHRVNGGEDIDTSELATRLIGISDKIEGISISGGEPFQQPEALLDLLARLKNSALSILIFTGYTLREVNELPLGPAVLRYVDVLIAGRYVQSRHLGRGLLGSDNQRVHLLTDRYEHTDFANIPIREINIHADGSMTITGIAST